ncbi:MAG: SMP-30/gluconolactonase/LRE family protein [Bacteroidota bacterium]
MHKAEILYQSQCDLGEAPVWHKERNSYFWVDVNGRAFFEYALDTLQAVRYQLDYRVSLVLPFTMNEVILALQGGIAKFNLETKTLQWLPSPDVDWDTRRFNDGGIDANGRLWVSTMHLDHEDGAAAVYLIEQGGITEKINALSIPNGFIWSPDNTKLYYTDSLTATVSSYFFNLQTASLSFEKIAIRIPEHLGLPDGMAMDQEGMLWIALWGGFGVGRFNPQTGEMIEFINVPAPHVSCCCFAGPDLDRLLITTARSGMTDEALQKYPDSGDVFIFKTNVRGLMPHQPKL